MELTGRELEAVHRLVAVHGGRWKQEMRRGWEGQRIRGVSDGDAATLRSLRDRPGLGVSWLIRTNVGMARERGGRC